ncbi:MAG: homoserine O-acetyltransferase [Neisseriaceae bacterium]
MTDQSVGIVIPQTIAFEEPLLLKQGVHLPRFELRIETYGHLNPSHDNAILICHALSGNHHVAGKYHEADTHAGWWDYMVGPGKPIDTRYFFVVGVNNLGGCHGSTGPTSLNPETGQIYGPNFPLIHVEDWIASQTRVADFFNIRQWAAVVGGSLGGMQALQWAIDFPSRLRSAVIIAAAPKLSAQNIAFNDVARQAILSDPNFHHGFYQAHNTKPLKGLSVARMMGHITYLAEAGLGLKFGRELSQSELQYSYDSEFEVESYLRYQGDKFAEAFDANSYLLMTKALDYFDPAAAYGHSLQAAMHRVEADILLISFTSDWRFSPERSKEMVQALLHAEKKVQYLEIESEHGHDAFLLQDAPYLAAIRLHFERLASELTTHVTS